jgi:predicted ATPase
MRASRVYPRIYHVTDSRHLVQARLRVEALPEALARQVTQKAEGNPLFAEEIISFLSNS